MRHKTILQPGEHRGFKKAIAKIQLGDEQKVRNELQKIIGGTPSKVYYYMAGKTIIRQTMTKKLTKLFSRYGIETEEIFDE